MTLFMLQNINILFNTKKLHGKYSLKDVVNQESYGHLLSTNEKFSRGLNLNLD